MMTVASGGTAIRLSNRKLNLGNHRLSLPAPVSSLRTINSGTYAGWVSSKHGKEPSCTTAAGLKGAGASESESGEAQFKCGLNFSQVAKDIAFVTTLQANDIEPSALSAVCNVMYGRAFNTGMETDRQHTQGSSVSAYNYIHVDLCFDSVGENLYFIEKVRPMEKNILRFSTLYLPG